LVFWSVGALGFDGLRYEIRVDVDFPTGTYAGEMTLGLVNSTGIVLEELFFRLYPNADAIYGAAALEVLEVRVDGETAVSGTIIDETVFIVDLLEPLEPGAAVSIELTFVGRTAGPPTGGTYGILNRSDGTLTLTGFYPILAPYTEEGWVLDPVFEFGDAVTADAAAYVVDLAAAPALLCVATGRRTAETGDGTRRFEIERARDFSAVLLEAAIQEEEVVGGIAIRTTFRPGSEAAAVVARRRAGEAAVWYSERIGRLPFDEIEIVEVPLQGVAGVEFTGIILVSSQYAQHPTDPFYTIIVAHEIAHQWFYAVVGNDVVEAPWLDEGLVTYLTAAYLEAAGDAREAERERDRWRSRYEAVQATHPDLTIASPLYLIPDAPTYSTLAYSGAALFFEALAETMGESAFYDGLAAYYEAMSFQLASPGDLFAALEDACGCSIDGVLARFGLR